MRSAASPFPWRGDPLYHDAMTAQPDRDFASLMRDEFRFARTFLENPLGVGAVVPSGRALSRKVASFVDPGGTLPVLELGAGTGVLTQALLELGIAPSRIVAVEYDAEFCALLRARFPGIVVIQGDAYDLDATLPPEHAGPFAEVVSGLPLLNKPKPIRRALVLAALDRVVAGGRLIQFSYGLAPGVPADREIAVTSSPWVIANFPPARVWLYSRR